MKLFLISAIALLGLPLAMAEEEGQRFDPFAEPPFSSENPYGSTPPDDPSLRELFDNFAERYARDVQRWHEQADEFREIQAEMDRVDKLLSEHNPENEPEGGFSDDSDTESDSDGSQEESGEGDSGSNDQGSQEQAGEEQAGNNQEGGKDDDDDTPEEQTDPDDPPPKIEHIFPDLPVIVSPQPEANIPLAFKLDPYDKIVHTGVYPDQCKLWNTDHSPNRDKLWFFDALDDDEKPLCMRIKMDGGYRLFIDHNDNDKADGCYELLCSFYWRQTNISVYEILDNPAFNTDNDDWISEFDTVWSKVKAWRPTENTTHTMDELGIAAINIRNYVELPTDYTGFGQYADCKYTEDWAYHQWIESGGKCDVVSLDAMRITHYNPIGIMLDDFVRDEQGNYVRAGTVLPTFDYVMGFWNEREVETSLDNYPEGVIID